eukprot:130991-Pleurochrysis_carterae.AAC.4
MARPCGAAIGTVHGGRAVVLPALSLWGVEVVAFRLHSRITSRELMLQPANQGGVARSARKLRMLLGPSHAGRWIIGSVQTMTRIPKETPEDLDRGWALRPTEALKRMHHRLRKAVGRIVLTLGRIS